MKFKNRGWPVSLIRQGFTILVLRSLLHHLKSQKLNLNTYDNLLMLRVEWRFNKGRSKQRSVQEYEFDTERRQDKGLL